MQRFLTGKIMTFQAAIFIWLWSNEKEKCMGRKRVC